MDTFMLFHIVAHDGEVENSVTGGVGYKEKVVLRLIDKTYEDALEKAKNIIKKKEYFLAEVVEYRAKDGNE